MKHLYSLISFVGLFFISFAPTANSETIARPFIWLTASEKKQVIAKINEHQWAKSRFDALKERTDNFAPKNKAERLANIKRLPLDWSNKSNRHFPRFIEQENVGNDHLRRPLQSSLQAAIDCGILFQLTSQESYAKCAADILYTTVKGLISTPLPTGIVRLKNNGWIIPKNHLLESRIYSAQIPLIYDFVYEYLKQGGQVYDLHLNKLVDFDFESAQHVFITYAQMALDSGLIDNNWPVLESTSLVHNALAIDDPELRNHYLMHYLEIDTEHQDSLAKVAKSYPTPADIWPESLNYSMHVAYFSTYLMTLIDRIEPTLKLGNKYQNVATALLLNEQFQYPNHTYPAFGDGNRRYKDNFLEFELAYKLGVLNNNATLTQKFANKLRSSIALGQYDRSRLLNRHTSAKPYYAPIELLWSVAELPAGSAQSDFTDFTTVHIPFAGLFIQRNVNTHDPINNGLMSVIGGGSYVHGHASGIDMELYGQGHVLGVEAGKGVYVSDVHQNYHRLFAGHNTVISNGASASKGDWINLGIERVQQVAMEPGLLQDPVSDKYSFVTVSFNDAYNLIKPAQHQRTNAIIRLSDDFAYYVDIFRAKSDIPTQYHDYLYRNIADTLEIFTAKAESSNVLESSSLPVKLDLDNERYSLQRDVTWQQDRVYLHPGWHYFKDVKSSSITQQNVIAKFTATQLKSKTKKHTEVTMRAHIVEGLPLTITTAKAPKSKIEDAPYNQQNLPILILRHQGETWRNPFVVAYESTSKGKNAAIKSTERLLVNGEFKGVKVVAQVNGKTIHQYILVHEKNSETYKNEELGIMFTGSFGIVTLIGNKLTDLYIGKGKSIRYQNHLLNANETSERAYKAF